MNWKQLYKLLVCLILVTPLLTGCWDRLEIEERGTILGLAIDPIVKNVQNTTGPFAKSDFAGYKLTAQVAIPGRIPLGPGGPSGGGGPTAKPVLIMSKTGKTIDDAVNNLQQELANRVFFGHLRIIVVNQTLAKSGMQDVQDFFRRNAEIRRLAWLIISKGSAGPIIEATPQLSRVPTLYLVSIMDNAVRMGKIPNVFLGNFWSTHSSNARDPVLPFISLYKKERIEIEGLAVFKGDRMVSNLNQLGTAAYMELTGEHKAGYGFAVPVPGDPKHSATIKGSNRKTKIKLRKNNGKPFFDVYMRAEANLEEKTGKTINNVRMMKQIGKDSTQLLLKNQEKTIKMLKECRSDVIGFGEYVRGEYPEYWRKFHSIEDWDREFANLDIRLHLDVELRRTGMSSR
ncbi:MAG: Ger(x)C family spore germination protein [Bacteroidetes bacterium]|nr:MAG: Ger(x)C family spore germination protein [Bacteroidota bacterium]